MLVISKATIYTSILQGTFAFSLLSSYSKHDVDGRKRENKKNLKGRTKSTWVLHGGGKPHAYTKRTWTDVDVAVL